MPTIDAFGTQLYYERYGSGPAIVFVHDGSSNHLVWWRNIPAFADRYTCITYDQRGFGLHIDPRAVEDQPGLDEDLNLLLDTLELDDVRLVGQSLGGWTIGAFIAHYVGRARAAVVAGPVVGFTTPEVEEGRARAHYENLPTTTYLSERFERSHAPETLIRSMITTMNPPSASAAVGGQIERMKVTPAQAAKATTPILFLEGALDTWTPPEIVLPAAKLFPTAEIAVLPDRCHGHFYEEPDEFNAEVEAFFTRVGVSARVRNGA